MLVIAHRGASAELPENTLPAFERAIELGADAIEFDVHADATGRLLVTHAAPRPSATAGKAVFTYTGVNPGINSSNAPNILGKSYTITADVDVPRRHRLRLALAGAAAARVQEGDQRAHRPERQQHVRDSYPSQTLHSQHPTLGRAP